MAQDGDHRKTGFLKQNSVTIVNNEVNMCAVNVKTATSADDR